MKIWATSTSLAAAIGPVIGGALVKVAWQWVFLVNVPVGVIAVAGAVALLPETKGETAERIPDLLGALILAVGLGALALALVKGQEWGWAGSPTLIAFAAAAVAAALVIGRVLTHASPIVDPALLRVRTFFWANVTALLFCVAFGAVLPSVVLRLETGAGYSALATGLAVAPGPLMVPVFAAVGQRLAKRGWAAGRIVALGNSMVFLGAVVLALGARTEVDYLTQVLPGWLIVGVGVGFSLPSLLASATVDLPPARVSTGSGIVNTSRQLGYVLGVAMLVALLGTLTASGDDALNGFRHSWWTIAAVALLSVFTALGITGRAQPQPISTTRAQDGGGSGT